MRVSLSSAPSLSLCEEVESTGEKEVNHSEEGNDEEKLRNGGEKDGTRDQGGILLLCQKEAKALKHGRHSHQIPVESGKTSPTYCGICGQWLQTRKAHGKKRCRDKLERESKKFSA